MSSNDDECFDHDASRPSGAREREVPAAERKRTECRSFIAMGRYCRRASCTEHCHRLYLLDVRAFWLWLFDELPAIRPMYIIRFGGKMIDADMHLVWRRTICDELTRRRVPYALVTAFEPHNHDAGFVRTKSRKQAIAAVKAAARRIGVPLSSADYAVSRVDDPVAWAIYVTKADEVGGPAPAGYRVFLMSRSFSPISFSDGRQVQWMRLATDPDPSRRLGCRPGLRTRARVLLNVERRMDSFDDSIDLRDWYADLVALMGRARHRARRHNGRNSRKRGQE